MAIADSLTVYTTLVYIQQSDLKKCVGNYRIFSLELSL